MQLKRNRVEAGGGRAALLLVLQLRCLFERGPLALFLSALPVLSLERIYVTPHLCDICRGEGVRGGDGDSSGLLAMALFLLPCSNARSGEGRLLGTLFLFP